jgi:hypothetical protein
MADPTFNDVLQEAVASASPDKIMIDTLSIYYDGLVDDGDQPSELYLFNGDNAHAVTQDGVPQLFARIEASAARNGGQMATFLGLPFQFALPPMNTDAVTAASLTIDSVGREMHEVLELASKAGKRIEVTLRTYWKDHEDDGPQNLPPRRFLMVGVTGANGAVSGRLAFLSIGNRPFPFDTYKPDAFRTLANA